MAEMTQDAFCGVAIQAEPCYRGSVIHKKPLVVVNVLNNLADACRIRICSFNESHNCSIQQVVRFSIYQEPTAVGPGCSVPQCGTVPVARRRWLSFFR